jgi:hypothetical protein
MTLPGYSKYFRLLLTAAATLLLVACATETLTSSWMNPEYSGGNPLAKTAVIVVAKDEKIRRFAEDQMIKQMPKGTVSVAGYTMFDKPEEDKDKVRDSLIKDGFDSVLVSRLVSVDKTNTYVPPQTYGGVVAQPYYGSMTGYYGQAYRTTYTEPGYVIENTTVVVETMLYRLPDGMLVWTGTTKSLDPQSKAELVQGITMLIGTELQKKHLLGAGK